MLRIEDLWLCASSRRAGHGQWASCGLLLLRCFGFAVPSAGSDPPFGTPEAETFLQLLEVEKDRGNRPCFLAHPDGVNFPSCHLTRLHRHAVAPSTPESKQLSQTADKGSCHYINGHGPFPCSNCPCARFPSLDPSPSVPAVLEAGGIEGTPKRCLACSSGGAQAEVAGSHRPPPLPGRAPGGRALRGRPRQRQNHPAAMTAPRLTRNTVKRLSAC